MGFKKFTAPIKRADLVRDCLRELKLWPGCELIGAIAVLLDGSNFSVRVTDYRTVNKRIADRALRCIEREKHRHYHVVADQTSDGM